MDDVVEKILTERKAEETILVAVDFDECVIEEHLSRRITEFYAHRVEILEENKHLHGSDAIRSLFNAYVGLTREEFESAVKQLASAITWRSGFLDMGNKLTTSPYFFVFVSSGIGDAVRIASNSVGLTKIHVIGSEVAYGADGTIQGASTVVGDAEKAHAVEALSASGLFEKIITVGHGAGDIHLIEAGTPGFRFSLRDAQEAMDKADHILDSWEDLNRYI